MTSTHPEPGRVTSGVLAVAVHILFIMLLVFGIRWQQRPPEPVVVDLWQDIPPPKPQQIVRPAPEPPPVAPPPKPEVLPPEPPKPVPVAKPLPPEQPSRADIELKEKQRKLREQKLAEQERRQEELRQKEEARKEELRQKEEARKEDLRKKEEARKEQEALRREEQLRQEELKRQAAAQRKEEEKRLEEARREEERRMEKDAETRRSAILEEQQKLALAARVRAEEDARKRAIAEAAAARQRQLDQFIGAIRKKIHSRIAVPPGMNSSAEAVYSVTLLPGGEVLEARLVKSSGVPAYDAAIERAIRLADPLPVPNDPDLFQQLRQANYKFRPFE